MSERSNVRPMRREGGQQVGPGLAYHFKVEVERNSTLAGKGADDPYLDHVEVDVHYEPGFLLEKGTEILHAGSDDVAVHQKKVRDALNMGVREATLAVQALKTALMIGSLPDEVKPKATDGFDDVPF